MAFNPKAKSIKDIVQKDVSKKSLKLLGKKFSSSAKMAPFFIKTDHVYGDGTKGPLFIFGKIKKYKSEIKFLKGPTELHGLCYLEEDASGKTILCLAPSKGKLSSKEMQLRKAMKEAFTSTFANFRILDPIAEEAAEAAAEAVEAMEEELGDAMEEARVEENKKAALNQEAQAETLSQAVQQMRERVNKMEDLLNRMEANTNKNIHEQLDQEFRQLLAEVQNRR